jgi:hypothetical protein
MMEPYQKNSHNVTIIEVKEKISTAFKEFRMHFHRFGNITFYSIKFGRNFSITYDRTSYLE